MSLINRVATASMYDNSIRNISGRQNTLVELNEKLTAGKRVLRASDDPVAAAQAERAMTRITRIQTEQRALDVQRNAVAQAESAMGDAIGLIQDMRELLVNAGDGSHSPADRRTIAHQLQSLRDQLLDVSNRKDTNGLPLLGALGSALEPFLGASSSGFAGLPGQGTGSSIAIPNMLDGDSAFMFQPKRDGVYNAGISNAAIPPNPLNGRQFGTSAVTVVDAAKVTTDPATGKGDVYEVVFKNVGPGASPNTSTATYNIINKTTGVASPDVVVPDFPNDKPLSIEISEAATPGAFVPGLKFNITATPTTALNGTVTLSPADGDTITLSPSASVLNVIDDAIRDIGGANNSNDAVQAVGQALANMDLGMARLSSVRSYAGELLLRADRITGNQDTREIQLEGDRSRAEDLDFVKGISDFENNMTGYQAALQSYAMVQKLSMFNYLS